MKIRSTEQLIDGVAAEISWRRKELTDVRYLLESAAGNRAREETMTRAGVAMLYAHWEGFVKAVAEMYLEFVCMQRCKNSELADNMLAVVLRSRFNALGASNKIQAPMALIEFFRTDMEKRSTLPYKRVIRTEANLSSTVLMEILKTLGLETIDYESKRHLLDNQLLAKRNHIAHGNAVELEPNDYLQLQDEILVLINLLRNQIENAAVTGRYLQAI